MCGCWMAAMSQDRGWVLRAETALVRLVGLLSRHEGFCLP